MRRFTGYARLFLLFLLPAYLGLLQGCAGPLIRTMPVSGHEARTTAAAFARYQETHRTACAGSLDVEVDVTALVSGWFSNRKGKLSGYLQVLKPGYIKFVALNPLGQPILIFLTDGNEFKLLNIIEGRAYMGSVNSETFKKYVPAGFEPKFSYYWLTGQLPPDVEITKISQDKEKRGYWLKVRNAAAANDHIILFAPDAAVVLRHLVMNDEGESILDIVYQEYQPENSGLGETGCAFPSRISISSNSGMEKRIELNLYSFISGGELSPADFKLVIPDNLEKRPVN